MGSCNHTSSSVNMVSLKLFVLMAVVIAAVECQSYGAPSYSAPDYKPTYKSDYKPSYSKGRVNIQVYRGPDEHKGYDKGYDKGGYGYDDGAFAPWGYYVTQPEDDKPYGYH